MKHTTLRRSAGIAAAALSLSVSLAACSSDDGDTAADDTSSDTSAAPETSEAPAEPTEEASSDSATAEIGDEFGDGCAAVPPEGEEGSFAAMVQDPVGTAASTNPVLSTLVSAVVKADLVDTLNQAPELTVFAPANTAFDAIPADQLNALLEDKAGLTKLLTHHVIGKRLDPEAVVGTQDTLAGDTVTVEGDTDGMTVDGANVVCGNVQTANATVYIIDKVLA